MSRTDTAQLTTLRTEVLVWRALETAVREPVAVYAPPATGGVYNVRVAIRQRNAGEARNAIAAVMSCMANVKNVFVVDPDIDVFSDDQMEWALATRLRPERDIHVDTGFRVSPLDPTLPEGDEVGREGRLRSHAPVRRTKNLELSSARAAELHRPRFRRSTRAARRSEVTSNS